MVITTDILLKAYASGIFPMAESADSRKLLWLSPEERGIIPLERLHIPKRLLKTIRQKKFQIRINSAFEEVISLCAESTANRPETWINQDIKRLYTELHNQGLAHSVEVWRQENLVGGLYGVALGGAFFGESMFSRERDTSKIALVYLWARLKATGFTLLDTQFVTDHLRQFGAVDIPRSEYLQKLEEALWIEADFALADEDSVQKIIFSKGSPLQD